MKKIAETAWHIVLTLATAAAVALGMHVFIYPGNFAPSGIDGIATMLRHLTGISAGAFIFLINMPLLIAAWFVLKRRYVVYTLLYTFALSLFLILLDRTSFFQYQASGERLMSAVFGGVAQGLTGIMLRLGSSSGGIDIVACMIQKRMPYRNVESIISGIAFVIVGVSWFVYRDLDSVLLSVIEIFVCERVTAAILRKSRNAVKFEVVCSSADALRRDILTELDHGATVVKGRGLYSSDGKEVVLCVVHYRQIPLFLRLMAKHPDTFVYYSDVMGVRGNWSSR